MEGRELKQFMAKQSKLRPSYPFRKLRDLYTEPFSYADRVAALRFVEKRYYLPHSPAVPKVEVRFFPTSEIKDTPLDFPILGPLAWDGRDEFVRFNGFRMRWEDPPRMAILTHEIAHKLFKLVVMSYGTRCGDKFAALCAMEGISLDAQREYLRASGYVKPLWRKIKDRIVDGIEYAYRKMASVKPETGPDPYELGHSFFSYLKERMGHANAFHLLASNLPRNLDEIKDPKLYLMRVALEQAHADEELEVA